MKGFNFGATITRASAGSTWTCRNCLSQAGRKRAGSWRGYATKNQKGHTYESGTRAKRKNGRILLAAGTGALGATAAVFTDDAKHLYGAVERSGRVASTLAVCINE